MTAAPSAAVRASGVSPIGDHALIQPPAPRAGIEIPNGVYLTCREGGSIKWTMDRR